MVILSLLRDGGEVEIGATSATSNDGYGTSGTLSLTYNLSDLEGNTDWFVEFSIRGNALQEGPYTTVISNESVLTSDQEETGYFQD